MGDKARKYEELLAKQRELAILRQKYANLVDLFNKKSSELPSLEGIKAGEETSQEDDVPKLEIPVVPEDVEEVCLFTQQTIEKMKNQMDLLEVFILKQDCPISAILDAL